MYELYDDNQKTSAIGYYPVLAATQGGPMDDVVTAIGVLGSKFQKGELRDAREIAFASNSQLGAKWKKGESTGVHAEVIIIRAWLELLVTQGLTIPNAISRLAGRHMLASQPACWYCYALMKKWNIQTDSELGNKPSTAWRHPLQLVSIPNAAMPGTYEAVKLAVDAMQ